MKNLHWRLRPEYESAEGFYVLTGHNSGNITKAVRLCGGNDYVTRKFENDMMADSYIWSAIELVERLTNNEISWEQAKKDF